MTNLENGGDDTNLDDILGSGLEDRDEAIIADLVRKIDDELAGQGILPEGTKADSLFTLNDLAREVRYFFEPRGDIKDFGAADVHFVRQVGINVCTSPDLLEVIIDRAKADYADEEGWVRLDDIVKARQVIDIERMERKQTIDATFFLLNHAVAREEIDRLLETGKGRYKIRSLARLLKEPIVGNLAENLMHEAGVGGAYLYEDIAVRALDIANKHRHEQSALNRGDSEAIARRERRLRRPDMGDAADERALLQEEETLSDDIPRPEDV